MNLVKWPSASSNTPTQKRVTTSHFDGKGQGFWNLAFQGQEKKAVSLLENREWFTFTFIIVFSDTEADRIVSIYII